MLFTNMEYRGKGIVGWLTRTAMGGIEIKIDDLVHGKEIDCKDIGQMISVEENLTEDCENFKRMLDTAAQFGGEQVIDF